MRANAIHTLIASLVLLGALLPASQDAQAQWKWRDADGRVHYSDQPPPPNVPESRIMRSTTKGPPLTAASAPSPQAAAAPQAETGSAPGASGPEAAKAPKTWAERAAEMRKRDTERQDAQRKEEDLARKAAALGQACEGMRAEARTLESGMRIARVNAQGEQEFVTEEERALRLDVLHKDLQAHCPTS